MGLATRRSLVSQGPGCIPQQIIAIAVRQRQTYPQRKAQKADAEPSSRQSPEVIVARRSLLFVGAFLRMEFHFQMEIYELSRKRHLGFMSDTYLIWLLYICVYTASYVVTRRREQNAHLARSGWLAVRLKPHDVRASHLFITSS